MFRRGRKRERSRKEGIARGGEKDRRGGRRDERGDSAM